MIYLFIYYYEYKMEYEFGEQNGNTMGFWYKFDNTKIYFFTNDLEKVSNLLERNESQVTLVTFFKYFSMRFEFDEQNQTYSLFSNVGEKSPRNNYICGFQLNLSCKTFNTFVNDIKDDIIERAKLNKQNEN